MKKILFFVFVAAIAGVNVRSQEFTFTTTAADTTGIEDRSGRDRQEKMR